MIASTAVRTDPLAAEPITDAQRRALFAAGRAHGLDIEGIRAMTPGGSISMLNRRQAAAILERLNSGTPHAHPRPTIRGPRRPKGVYRIATQAQLGKIESIRIDLGWSREKLDEWLAGRTFYDGRTMSVIRSTVDANQVIELLKAVAMRHRRAVRRRAGMDIAGTSNGLRADAMLG